MPQQHVPTPTSSAGVQQRVLAVLTDLSAGRVSQIVAEERSRPVDVAAVRAALNAWDECGPPTG